VEVDDPEHAAAGEVGTDHRVHCRLRLALAAEIGDGDRQLVGADPGHVDAHLAVGDPGKEAGE
jgi:hypothetical protein